jgi:hypothetical protein
MSEFPNSGNATNSILAARIIVIEIMVRYTVHRPIITISCLIMIAKRYNMVHTWGGAKTTWRNDQLTSMDVAYMNHREIIALNNNSGSNKV